MHYLIGYMLEGHCFKRRCALGDLEFEVSYLWAIGALDLRLEAVQEPMN